MSSKVKNIIIIAVVAIALIVAFLVFFKKPAQTADLVSTSASTQTASSDASASAGSPIGQDFLTTLLNVKSIKLDDSIFSNPAFLGLRDTSIQLVQDPTQEGRPNPFAPIGSDAVTPSAPSSTTSSSTTTSTSSTSSTSSSNTSSGSSSSANTILGNLGGGQ